LKPKAPQSGYVDGAWWPHSGDLVAELPELLPVLSIRLGRIHRLLYNLDSWAQVPRRMVFDGQVLRLGGYHRQPVNTIEALGLHGGRITLLVVPPLTDAEDAHAIMMAAAQPGNRTTTDGLLGVSEPERAKPVPV
jgi:hypothetical protein